MIDASNHDRDLAFYGEQVDVTDVRAFDGVWLVSWRWMYDGMPRTAVLVWNSKHRIVDDDGGLPDASISRVVDKIDHLEEQAAAADELDYYLGAA